uniref:Peptidase M1 membrane alanine aminopeptidase domain-containing protein n=1 Tax=Anopheles melas TaxID=34690 RepID=A0A182TZT7_9DIPT
MVLHMGKIVALLLLVVSSSTLAVFGQRSAAHPEWNNREFAPAPDTSSPRDDLVDQSYRLPTDTVPTHYTIRLHTDLHTGSRAFSGIVDIEFDVIVPTDAIVVHSRDLLIAS